jgi:hypothetical protein
MKVSAIEKHIINAYNKKIAVMLWGPPGVGKSSMVAQVARKLGIDLIDIRLAQMDPTDLRGTPVPNHHTSKTDNYYPSLLPESGRGIIFLDEMEKASVAVKNAALQLVLDRKIGAYTLPDGWSIVSAGNREDDGCFSMPLGSALSNRMIHLEVQPDYSVWLEWALKNNISSSILGYLAFRPEHLYRNNTDININAFPSPRSWNMLNTMLIDVDDRAEQNELMEAIIGLDVAKEYRVWDKFYKNVNVEDIIFKGVIPEAINSGEQSVIYAITIAVAHYIKNYKASLADYEDNIAKFVSHLTREMRMVFCRQTPEHVLVKFIKHPAFKLIADELIKIVLG